MYHPATAAVAGGDAGPAPASMSYGVRTCNKRRRSPVRLLVDHDSSLYPFTPFDRDILLCNGDGFPFSNNLLRYRKRGFSQSQ